MKQISKQDLEILFKDTEFYLSFYDAERACEYCYVEEVCNCVIRLGSEESGDNVLCILSGKKSDNQIFDKVDFLEEADEIEQRIVDKRQDCRCAFYRLPEPKRGKVFGMLHLAYPNKTEVHAYEKKVYAHNLVNRATTLDFVPFESKNKVFTVNPCEYLIVESDVNPEFIGAYDIDLVETGECLVAMVAKQAGKVKKAGLSYVYKLCYAADSLKDFVKDFNGSIDKSDELEIIILMPILDYMDEISGARRSNIMNRIPLDVSEYITKCKPSNIKTCNVRLRYGYLTTFAMNTLTGGTYGDIPKKSFIQLQKSAEDEATERYWLKRCPDELRKSPLNDRNARNALLAWASIHSGDEHCSNAISSKVR